MTATAPPSHDDPTTLRHVMVDRQVRTFDVTDEALLARMIELPRELFLPESLRPFAYSDGSLQAGATGDHPPRRLLSPMTLARMIQATHVRPADRALEIAGGGGYGAGLLAGLCASAVTVESESHYTSLATSAFDRLGMTNARAVTGSLIDAGGETGPFDVILVAGAVEESPDSLLSLLSEGGRLVAIFRMPDEPQTAAGVATLWMRSGGTFGRTPLFNASAPVLSGFRKQKAFAF